MAACPAGDQLCCEMRRGGISCHVELFECDGLCDFMRRKVGGGNGTTAVP